MGLKNLLKVLGITKGRWNRYEGEFDVDREFSFVEAYMTRDLLRGYGSAWKSEQRKPNPDIAEYRVYNTSVEHYVNRGNANLFRITRNGDKTRVYISMADQKGNADALFEERKGIILKDLK